MKLRRWAFSLVLLLALVAGCKIQGDTSDVTFIRDVEYGKGGGHPLLMDIVRPKDTPKDPMPAIVFIHGGGWSGGSKNDCVAFATIAAQHGCFAASIDYRLTNEAPFPAQIEDCKCAIRWARAHAKEYNVDSDRIGVWGGSAGGHLVALLGTTAGIKEFEGTGGWQDQSSKVQAVCDCFGPTDLLKLVEDAEKGILPPAWEQYLGKIGSGDDILSKLVGGRANEKKDVCRRASPITYVTKDDAPFLICHGDQDPLVPLDQSILLDKALKNAGVESTLIVVNGGGHGWADHPEVDKAVADFFEKHLKKEDAK
jgi:acetyl esterase/lipase